MTSYCVILAGGSGQRLWPLSRADRPKQLVPVLDGKSLLEIAFERLDGLVPPDRCWVCAYGVYEPRVRERLSRLGRFIGEPYGRDTLPAVALSCAHAYVQDYDAVVAFLTADHVIRPIETFKVALARAFSLVEAEPDILVTFGVRPTFTATGYGYLELGKSVTDSAISVRRSCARRVKRRASSLYTPWWPKRAGAEVERWIRFICFVCL